jgi:hypothetical protein
MGPSLWRFLKLCLESVNFLVWQFLCSSVNLFLKLRFSSTNFSWVTAWSMASRKCVRHHTGRLDLWKWLENKFHYTDSTLGLCPLAEIYLINTVFQESGPLIWYISGLQAGWPRFDSWRWNIFLSPTVARPILGPTHPAIQWILGALSQGLKRQGCEADLSHWSSAELKKGGAIPPLPHMSSWHSA